MKQLYNFKRQSVYQRQKESLCGKYVTDLAQNQQVFV